jgi:hypothetical protein
MKTNFLKTPSFDQALKETLLNEAGKQKPTEKSIETMSDSDFSEMAAEIEDEAENENIHPSLKGKEISFKKADLEWDLSKRKRTFSKSKETKLAKWNYQRLYEFTAMYYANKIPLLIYGDSGIGKSEFVRSFAEAQAEPEDIGKGAVHMFAKQAAKGRRFIDFLSATPERQEDAIENADKYFLWIDVRGSQMEPTDVAGVPKITNQKNYLDTQIPRWLYVMGQPGAEGILFLDEINHSDRSVQNALHAVVEKKIGTVKLQPEIAIFAAGNLDSTYGNRKLARSLVRRFAGAELIADPEGWLKWAEGAGVDPRILAFIRANPSQHFNPKPVEADGEEHLNWANPANLKRLSDAIKNLEEGKKLAGENLESGDVDIIENLAHNICGPEWAEKFIAFMTNYSLFHFPTVVKDAEEGQFGSVESGSKYLDPSTRYVVLLGTLEKLKMVLYKIVDFVNAEIKPEGVEFKAFLTDENLNKVVKQLPTSWKTILIGSIKILNALGDAFKANMIHHMKKDYMSSQEERGMSAFLFFFVFASRGDYDQTTKKHFLEHTVKMIKSIKQD